MKILVISECYPSKEKPQYGIFIKQQNNEMQKLGHNVDIIVPFRHTLNTDLQKEISNIGLIYKVGYKTVRYDLFPLTVAKKVYKNIFDFIFNGRYDLVSIHITSDVILKIAVKICNELNIPIVVHYHGLNVWNEYKNNRPIRQKLIALYRRNLLKQVSAVIGVSRKVTDIVQLKLKTVPCYTVYNGVDVTLFVNAEKEKNEIFTVLGVGNLIEIKGFEYLIRAFAEFKKEHDAKLKIIGEGIEKDNLQNLVNVLGVEKDVEFMGRLPYCNVAKEMASSDVFVLPSFYEALGCVYLEAMSCMIPVVGVKGMGIDEIIEDKKNGYLVEPKNSEQISGVLNEIYFDCAVAAEIAKKGKLTAERFTWENSAKALDKIYRQVVKK